MKELELELFINGEKKIFRPAFLSGLVVRKAFDLINTMQKQGNEGVKLDQAVDFICLVYANQFTQEEFYNGIAAEGMMEKINDIIMKVVNKASGAVKNSQNPVHNKNRR